MDSNIEHIIKNNQYFELDEAQKKLISEWAKNSDEFDALRNTLLTTDELVELHEKELNPTVKQRLDVRFAEKHDQNRLIWYNKLWLFLWPENSPFYKRPLIQFAAICLVVVITVPFFSNMNKHQLALNETETKESVDKFDEKENESEKEEEKEKQEYRKPLEKSVESVDENVESQKQELIENEAQLVDERIVKTKAAEIGREQIAENFDNSGWELNDDEVTSNAEGSSNRATDMLGQTLPSEDDQKDADYYSDKLDTDAPALQQVSRSDFSSVSKASKKVDTKETLDLLIALY